MEALTFDELVQYALVVYGVIALAMILSDQIAQLIQYLMWRTRKAGRK